MQLTSRKQSAAGVPDSAAQEGVAAVDKALVVLEAFDASQPALGLSALAQRTGLAKATLLRLIATLVSRAYLRGTADGRYQLGSAILQRAAVYQQTVQPEHLIRPILEELVDATGETASLNVREGDVQLRLYGVDSPNPLRDHIRIGQCFPVDRGCSSHVLKAFSGAAGPDCDQVRSRVVVTTHGEQFSDISGIAAPVFGLNQALVGALVLSGPTARFTDSAVPTLESLVLAASARLTVELGGNPSLFDLVHRSLHAVKQAPARWRAPASPAATRST